jgi:hypothetical protein
MGMALPLDCATDYRQKPGNCSDEQHSHLFLPVRRGRKVPRRRLQSAEKLQVMCVTAGILPVKLPCLARVPTSGLGDVMSQGANRTPMLTLRATVIADTPGEAVPLARPDHRRMKLLRVPLIVSAVLLGAGGCSAYDPPVEGDHTSEKYQTDVERCRTTSTETVRLKNAATPGRWIISPITGPPAVRAAIRTCMESKGYALQKTGD